MLLFLAIACLVLSVITGALIAFANGMSDAPDKSMSLWPAGVLLLISVTLFVARHYLHGKSITW